MSSNAGAQTYDVKFANVTISGVAANYSKYNVNHSTTTDNDYTLVKPAIFNASDCSNGDTVLVTMQIKCTTSANSNKLAIANVDGSGSYDVIIESGTMNNYTSWTEIKLVTKVGWSLNNTTPTDMGNTNIYVQFRRTDIVSGTTVVEMKDITVTAGEYHVFSGTASGYNLGTVDIASTTAEVGTAVSVNMLIRYGGAMSNNGWLWTTYTDGNGSMEAISEQGVANNKTFQTWQNVDITTRVAEGQKAQITIRNGNGGSAAYKVEVFVLSVTAA